MTDQELLKAIREITREETKAIIAEELKPINQRLDGMDQRLDRVDQRIDRVDQQLEQIEERLEALEENIEEVRAGTNALIEWSEKVSMAATFPLPNIDE